MKCNQLTQSAKHIVMEKKAVYILLLLLLLPLVIFTGASDKEKISSVKFDPVSYSVESWHTRCGSWSDASTHSDNNELPGIVPGHTRDDLILRVNSFDACKYRMALDDLKKTFPSGFKVESSTLQALELLEEHRDRLITGLNNNEDEEAFIMASGLLKSLDGQLLKNPLIDGKSVIAIQRTLGSRSRVARSENSANITAFDLGLAPSNFQNNSELPGPTGGWDNRFVEITLLNGERSIKTVYSPPDGIVIADPQVHFSGEKMLFSSIGTNDRWHIFELDFRTNQAKQITPEAYRDFDSFEPAYTPDGRIVFCATATFL